MSLVAHVSHDDLDVSRIIVLLMQMLRKEIHAGVRSIVNPNLMSFQARLTEVKNCGSYRKNLAKRL